MTLSEMLLKIFDGMTFLPPIDMEDVKEKVSVGQAVFLSDDICAMHFPLDGVKKPLDTWASKSEGMTLWVTHGCVIEDLTVDGEGIVQGFLSEKKVVELMFDFLKNLHKIRFNATDMDEVRKQFHALWGSYCVGCLPDPADVRKSIQGEI